MVWVLELTLPVSTGNSYPLPPAFLMTIGGVLTQQICKHVASEYFQGWCLSTSVYVHPLVGVGKTLLAVIIRVFAK